jgi:hypothetical protein
MTNRPTQFFLLLSLCVVLFSCAQNQLTMSVTEPAPISLDPELKNAVVINRSMATKGNKVLDNLDKILSLEGLRLDKEAAAAAVTALYGELGKNERFISLRLLDTLNVDNPGLGIFPAPLSWLTIQDMTKEQYTDLVFSLAFYDTDTKIDYKMVPVEVTTPVNVEVSLMEHQATITTQIKCGWRIYDIKNKIIVEEYLMTRNVTSSGRGINPVTAVKAALARKELVLNVSRKVGEQYAERILPYRIRVRRNYYVKGSSKFKIGKRRAQTGDWDGAAILWKEEVNHRKEKVAGRACYNMAIINEINGDLDNAIEWASKSYTDYRNKEALRYLNVLKNRVRKMERLDQQVGN